MPLRTQMFPCSPSGSGMPVVVKDAQFNAGNGCPMPVPPASSGSPAAQAGTGNETQLRGAVVLEDGGIGRPPAGRLQRPGIQLGTGADDGPDAGSVHAPGQSAFAEQPQHGGHQDQAGDAVMGDGGVDVADVEGFQGVELGTGIQALGEGVQVQAGGQRAGCKGHVVLRGGRRTRWTRRRTPARNAATW